MNNQDLEIIDKALSDLATDRGELISMGLEMMAEIHRLRHENLCEWRLSENGPCETGCGHTFSFEDGDPKENGADYCLYCGGVLSEVVKKGE
jgi:hypothetical protein